MDPDAIPDAVEASQGSGRIRVSKVGLQLPADRFIPVHSDDLVAAIVAQPERFPLLTAKMPELAEMMDRVVTQETTTFQRFLCRRYDGFNPARETKDVAGEPDPEELEALQRMVGYLLEKSNYERLDEREIETAIKVANTEGIRIRTDRGRLDRLELYVRGQTAHERHRRTLRRPLRGEARTVEVFRRLAVVFQFKGERWLNLKLFRDIPIADVEALLPHAEAAMSHLDRLKIAFGGAGAFGGVAWKVATGTAVLGQLAWAGIIALIGLSVRSFFGYRRARHVRTSQMTHNLYYRIVANNAGVIDQLLSSIAQEELKEAIAGYALLLHDDALVTEGQLGSAVSSWLSETFDVDIDFDAADSIETLDRFALWADRSTLSPVPPDEALRLLSAHWQESRTASYHLDGWDRLELRERDLASD